MASSCFPLEMGAGASLQVERIPKEAFTRVVVSYIAKKATDVSNDQFLQMIVDARLDGYIQGDDLVLVRAELDACLQVSDRSDRSGTPRLSRPPT